MLRTPPQPKALGVNVSRRHIFALLVAPWFAPLAFVIFDQYLVSGKDFLLSMIVAIFLLPISYISTFCVGVPIIFWLRNYAVLDIFRLSLSGCMAGVFVAFASDGLLRSFQPALESFGFTMVFWGAGSGFTVATAFGLLAGIPLRMVTTNDT